MLGIAFTQIAESAQFPALAGWSFLWFILLLKGLNCVNCDIDMAEKELVAHRNLIRRVIDSVWVAFDSYKESVAFETLGIITTCITYYCVRRKALYWFREGIIFIGS